MSERPIISFEGRDWYLVRLEQVTVRHGVSAVGLEHDARIGGACLAVWLDRRGRARVGNGMLERSLSEAFELIQAEILRTNYNDFEGVNEGSWTALLKAVVAEPCDDPNERGFLHVELRARAPRPYSHRQRMSEQGWTLFAALEKYL